MSVSSSSNSLIGWELTYKLVEKNICQKSDVIILLIHWVLIFIENFKCVGLGSEKTLNDTDRNSASELLPDGWNRTDIYLIRYTKNDVLYVISGTKSNDILIVTLLHVKCELASNIVVNIDDVVNDLRGPITQLLTNHSDLIKRIKRELIIQPHHSTRDLLVKGGNSRRSMVGGRFYNNKRSLRMGNTAREFSITENRDYFIYSALAGYRRRMYTRTNCYERRRAQRKRNRRRKR